MSNSKELEIVNGFRVNKGWLKRINDSQKFTRYSFDGKDYPRIKYGEEKQDWGVNA